MLLGLAVLTPTPIFGGGEGTTAIGGFLGKIPPGESAVRLFNGKDLEGWDGAAGIWSVEGGAIKGANAGVVPTSTYLFTNKRYRNFRLLFEVKQAVSPAHSGMHSAVAALGERFADQGNNVHGFRGPLLMFGNDWGIWDAYRLNRIVPQGPGARVEKRGDWNLIEILAAGNRIRFVENGTLVFDFTDQPEMLRESPIGLQIHANPQPQEFLFRGLVLTENPEDRVVTLSEK